MSINLETGLWRCFKTGKVGNFIQLYAHLEGCTYRKAYEELLFKFFLHEDTPKEPKKIESKIEDASSFERLFKDATDELSVSASGYLKSRKIEGEFLISKEGFYKDRLIIPFFNSEDKIFYFQARALKPFHEPKYLNCKNYKASQILYPFDYESDKPLFVTEGVFDCLSLRVVGLNATTTLSCAVSDHQMAQLKAYRGPIVVAYDSDDAGIRGARKFFYTALRHKLYVNQAILEGAKDWNDLLVTRGSDAVLKICNNFTPISKLSIAASGL